MTETNVLMEVPEKIERRIMTNLDWKHIVYILIGVVVFLVLLLHILLIICCYETLSGMQVFMRDNIQTRLNNTLEKLKTKWFTNGYSNENVYTIRRDDRYNST